MTRYWPLSTIARSPLMHPTYAAEVRCATLNLRISDGALYASSDVAMRTVTGKTPLAIVESTDAPPRRVYTEYPEFDDWFRLERGGFVQSEKGFFVMVIDALH